MASQDAAVFVDALAPSLILARGTYSAWNERLVTGAYKNPM